MSTKTDYQEKINTLIGKVKDDRIRSILMTCSKKGEYPRDAITDGGIEVLTKWILDAEKRLDEVDGY